MPSRRRRSSPPAGDLAARLGERVRAARELRRLSQTAVGSPHYGRAAVSAIERGRALPSLRMLRHLAARLGVAIRDLIPPEP